MRKIITILFLGLVLLVSCEEMIEIEYPANQIGTTQVYEDIRTANAALAGLFARLRDRSVITGGSYIGIGSLSGSYADDLDCYYYDQNGVVDIYMNLQQETNSTIKSIWEASYQQIYYANSIMHGASQSNVLPDADKNRLIGEALVVRSLIFLYLQQFFDDIPYTTSLNYEVNRRLSKTEGTTLLAQLELDLKEAVGLLEDDYRNIERIYPNRKVAQLLLANVYMLQNNWTLAEQTAELILESPLYQFQTDINKVFKKTGTHILWQLMPQNNGDATSEASFYYFTGSTPNSFVLTQDLVNSFSNDDLRKQNWMAEVTFNDDSWHIPLKYKNRSNNTDEYSIVFRLAEAYFIMAEALARQNRFNEALPYLNATRERAGLVGFTSLSGDAFFNELIAEKRREYFTEFGHRFLDLKRWGRLDALTAVKPNWQSDKSAWPLPQSELLLNPKLNPQNPGY
jgi:starch-binding outer membrane protein, SusD/RagB family